MAQNLAAASIAIIPVAFATALIVTLRIEQIAEPEMVQALGLQEARRQDVTDFCLMSLALGILVTLAYVLLAQGYSMIDSLLTGSAIGLAGLLSVAAAYLRPRAGLGGVPEVITIILIWAAGYGWLLPVVLRNFGILPIS